MPQSLALYLKDWGPESLLAILLLSIIFGRLQSRVAVIRGDRIQEARITEALDRERYHRAAAETLQQTVNLQAKQLGEMMEQGKTTIALLQSLQNAASPRYVDEGRHRGSA